MDTDETVALVGSLESSRFLSQLSDFVHKIGEIKSMDLQMDETTSIQDMFVSEFTGKKEYNVSRRIEAACDHGAIVNLLATQLKDTGFAVGNDRFIDLYVRNQDGLVDTLFEVKTDLASTGIYQAIGQLFFHSTRYEVCPRLVLVLPTGLDDTSMQRLSRLDIEVLCYHITEAGRHIKFSWNAPDVFMERSTA